MATSIGHLAVIVSANTAGLVGGLAAAGKGVSGFVGSIAKIAGVTSILGAVGGAAKAMYSGFADDKRAQVTFGALLGDVERAKELVDQLEVAGMKTTFGDSFMDAGQQLLQFNVAADDVVPTLNRLSEISAALNVPLNELAETFGEVRTRNVLATKQLITLEKQGIPIVQELMKTMGLSEDAVRRMIANGQVGFAQYEAAIKSATGEGGRFHGSVKKVGEGTGAMARTWQNFVNVLGEFGETLGAALGNVFKFEGGLGGVADWLASVAENMSSIQPVLESYLSGLARVWDFTTEAFNGIVTIVSECVTAVGGWLSDLTGITFQDVVDKLDWLSRAWGFFWNNFPLIVQVGAMKAALALVEWVNDTIHFLTVKIPEALAWFSRNWVEVLRDVVNFAGTIFENLGSNIVSVFKNLPGLISGSVNWGEVWTPLTEGFVPTIKEALNLTEREATEWEKGMKGRIGGLQAELAKGWDEAMRKPVVQAVKDTAMDMDDLISAIIADVGKSGRAGPGGAVREMAGGKGDTGPKFAGAFEAGSKEAYNLILQNRNMTLQPMERTAKATERGAAAADRQVAVLGEIKDKIGDSELIVADLGGMA